MRFETHVHLLIKLHGDDHWWSLGEFANIEAATDHLAKIIERHAKDDTRSAVVSYLCWPSVQDYLEPGLPW